LRFWFVSLNPADSRSTILFLYIDEVERKAPMWLWSQSHMYIIPPLVERGLYCNHLVRPSVRLSVHTFVTDISASTGRNDFIFDMWLWHGDLYHVSPFQAYRTSTSCLPRDLEFFMFAVMKTFVTDISASTGRNYFIFDMWLWHGDLYRVSPFQVYCTSTSCLPCDLEFFMFLQHFLVMSVEIYTNLTQMNEWGYS
jgi:hypothetical protein